VASIPASWINSRTSPIAERNQNRGKASLSFDWLVMNTEGEPLVQLMEDPRNAIDIQHAAALALDELGMPLAVERLGRANADHPFHSVSERRLSAEALFGVAFAHNRRQIVIGKAGTAADLLPLYPQPLYFTN